jgi:hypothetical protein
MASTVYWSLHYGLILHEIGLGGFIEDLMRHVLGPLAAPAYPEWGGAVRAMHVP